LITMYYCKQLLNGVEGHLHIQLHRDRSISNGLTPRIWLSNFEGLIDVLDSYNTVHNHQNHRS
jgi:hypothetical protein